MARPLMSNPRMTTTHLFGFLLLVIVFSSSLSPSSCPSALASSLPPSSQPSSLFQPVLTGFRCEGYNEVTSDGVVVIEANTHVKVTLFGEYFTTETIVGFTTEFVPHVDAVDRMISKNGLNESAASPIPHQQHHHHHQQARSSPTNLTGTTQNSDTISTRVARSVSSGSEDNHLVPADPSPQAQSPPPAPPSSSSSLQSSLQSSSNTSSQWPGAPLVQFPLPGVPSPTPVAPQVDARSVSSHPWRHHLSEAEIRLRRRNRRLLDSHAYDCTDYDRVISYKLSEENIITPNVAVLTIKLPELGSLSNPGMYYYFCLKQPAVPSELLAQDEAAAIAAAAAAAAAAASDDGHTTSALATFNQTIDSSRPVHSHSMANRTKHVWVHQGDEWWLMIKVEPPILSIANDCILIILLLFLSAVTSGLNLGLMSLDMNELAVISSCGDQRERSYARTIAPLRKRGNYLLCSLLLGNVMVNSTLTVILEEMTSGVVAVIGSTLAIVVLGEIVPQAFCARQGLAIGAKTIYLTYAFMIITFPLSYPISCLLDCILGAEKGHVYDRERLMEFIRITGNHTQLEADEVAIISGALKLKKIKVDQIMTKLEDVFMLPIDCMLDRKTIRSIIEKGYSRIPVYEFNDRKQIVALILAKDLALLDPDDQMPLASMLMYCKHPLIFIEDSATLDVALNEFKTGKSHMAIVRQIYDDGEVDKYFEAIGVVTLEDVIEEVLQTEINDETDTLSDNRRKRRRTEAQVAHLVDELIMESPAKIK